MTSFDNLREGIIAHIYILEYPDLFKPINLIIDYNYIFDLWGSAPHHENSIENVCEKHMEFINGLETKTIPVNLMFTLQCNAYLAAFSTLSTAARLKYLMTILYCTQPNHTITYDNIDKNMFDFLFAAQFIDLTDKGIPITTKEGMYFLWRFLTSKDLKKEFI